MKKSILVVLGLLIIIALLPVLGNSFIKSSIDKRVKKLGSLGLVTSKDESQTSYLNSSRHFEFLLEDSQKFQNYIKQYSDKQMPAYIDALLSGVLVGVDVEYSNLPFAKALSIEIYPLALSSKVQKSIAQSDSEFSLYVEKFLQSKGILYHIDYNLLNDDFKGYLKGVDEKYTLKEGIALSIKLDKANFSGNGELIAPKTLETNIKELYFSVAQERANLQFTFKKFSANSNFESQNTYVTSADVEEVGITLNGTPNDVNLSIRQIKLNGSSNEQGEHTELNSKISLKEMQYSSQEISFLLNKLDLDVALSGLDKKKFEELRVMISKKNNLDSFLEEKELQNAILELISKGMLLEIADFSLKSIELQNQDDLKGFKIKSKITITEDTSLGQKIKLSPLLALSNIDMTSKIELSKEIYMILLNSQPLLQTLNRYIKEDRGNYLFDISFIDSKMSINEKRLF
ncbi:MAG: hypothetical protein U9N39_00040 [Campylobacterota bacterium]|nr:hypothetical protein [Campylobacterota bacterium]